MERSEHLKGKWPALLAALLAACLALSVAAAPATARLAEALRYAKAHLVLDRALLGELEAEGVRAAGLGKARVQGRTVSMPVFNAFLEYGGGTGYAFMSGGLRLHGPHGTASLKDLVLNTAKDRFNAKVADHGLVLAIPEGVSGQPTRYGLEVAVKRLVLTGAGARELNRALGLGHLLRAGDSLGRMLVSGESPTVPLDLSRFEFSFDEAFRQKLAGLDITVSPVGASTQLSADPLAFSFPDATGNTNRGLGRGGISTPSYLRLSTAQHEANIAITANFEDQLDGRVSPGGSPGLGGSPLGEASFLGVAKIDSDGMVEAPPTPLTLSGYGAPVLNTAFGGGVAPFAIGERLGTISFAGRLGR